eukprot:423467-Pyramimonas_sp.AAC.1
MPPFQQLVTHVSASGCGAGAVPSDGEATPSASVLLGDILWERVVLNRGVLNCLDPRVVCLRGLQLSDGIPVQKVVGHQLVTCERHWARLLCQHALARGRRPCD